LRLRQVSPAWLQLSLEPIKGRVIPDGKLMALGQYCYTMTAFKDRAIVTTQEKAVPHVELAAIHMLMNDDGQPINNS
jgi:hypothetical protein